MKVKITEQQLRQIIKESMIQEARMAKRGISNINLKIPDCSDDIKRTLQSFRKSNGDLVFKDDKVAKSLSDTLVYGLTPMGCEVIKIGIVGLLTLMGYDKEKVPSDSNVKIDKFKIKEYCRLSENRVNINNDNFDSTITRLYFPLTVESIDKNEEKSVVTKSFKKDIKSIKDQWKKLDSKLKDDAQSVAQLAEIYKFTAELFKFSSEEEFIRFLSYVNKEVRETVKKLPTNDAKKTAINKAQKEVEKQRPEEILSDKLSVVFNDFENYAEKNEEFKEIFNDQEIQEFFKNF